MLKGLFFITLFLLPIVLIIASESELFPLETSKVMGTVGGILALIIYGVAYLTTKFSHKHNLYITMSPHSPLGNVHYVIKCSSCFGTWDMDGNDYYGTSKALKGEKMLPHLSEEDILNAHSNFQKP